MQTQNITQENFVTKNKKTLLIIAAIIVLSKLFGGENTDTTYTSGENMNNESVYTTSSGSIDPQVVGRWMHENLVSTSGSADYASFVSVKYFQFNEDGTYTVTDGGSAGGGDGYGYSASSGGVIESGTWNVQNGELCTSFGNGNSSHVYYQFSDGKLVLGRSGGYKFLSPAN